MNYIRRTNILWASTTELAVGHSNSITVHSFYHLLYVRDGKGVFFYNDTAYDISKGTCILVQPGVYHEIPADNHSLLGFHEIKFEIIDPYLSENLQEIKPLLLTDSVFETILTYVCDNYTQETDEDILRNVEYLFSTLLTLMFLNLATPKNPSSQYIIGSEYNHTTQKIIKYIEKNASYDFKLKYLGQALGMHPSYLCACFKKNTGHSIIDYLNYARIKMALQTMYFRNKTPLNEVAFHCGFGSVSNFNRMFKHYTGTTPSDILVYFKKISDSNDAAIRQIHDDLVLKRFPSINEAFDSLRSFSQIISDISRTQE